MEDTHLAAGNDVSSSTVPSQENEDDPIVHEIPVFLSQELSYNLHLLQYPLRPQNRPYSDVGRLVSARFKPKLRKIEFAHALIDDPSQYDTEADYEIPKLKLVSRTVPPKSNYAVGLFRNNRLYLTPLHARCRMLPSLDHIDAADEDDRADEEKKKDLAEGRTEDDANDLKPVMQKYKRRENERAPTSRKLTHSYLKLLQDQEPWIDLNIVTDDYTTSVHRDRLTQLPQVSVQAYNSALEYLAKICPKKDLFSHELPGEVERPPETLADRIKALLISAHVVSFDHVCIKLGIRTADVAKLALDHMTTFAHLVQGNWVVKSELVYPVRIYEGYLRTVVARNLAICLFAQSSVIPRKAIAERTHLDIATLSNVLKELGTPCGEFPDVDSHYRLKHDTDEAFLRDHAALANAHAQSLTLLHDSVLRVLQNMVR